VTDHKCLATAASRDKWIYHYKLKYLNFRDLNLMHNQVTGQQKCVNIVYKQSNIHETSVKMQEAKAKPNSNLR
jgi:hypothetical protein